MADADMLRWLLARDTSAPLIAHELAEKIRASIGPESYPHETDELVLRYVKGWRHAADFIDPEVST